MYVRQVGHVFFIHIVSASFYCSAIVNGVGLARWQRL